LEKEVNEAAIKVLLGEMSTGARQTIFEKDLCSQIYLY
jgi:hypothetical protein